MTAEYLQVYPEIKPKTLASFEKLNRNFEPHYLLQIYWGSRRIPKEVAFTFAPFKLVIPEQTNFYVSQNCEHLMFVNYRSGEIVRYYRLLFHRQTAFQKHADQTMRKDLLSLPTVAQLLGIPAVTVTAWRDYYRSLKNQVIPDLIGAFKDSALVTSEQLDSHRFRHGRDRKYYFDGRGLFVTDLDGKYLITYVLLHSRLARAISKDLLGVEKSQVRASEPVDAEDFLRYMTGETLDKEVPSLPPFALPQVKPQPVAQKLTLWQKLVSFFAQPFTSIVKI